MPYKDEPNRMTGRTTRLVKEAVRCLVAGKVVRVVAHDMRMAKTIQRMIVGEVGENSTKNLIASSINQHLWDRNTMSFRGDGHEVVTLVDHYAVWASYPEIFQAWMRWDDEDQS